MILPYRLTTPLKDEEMAPLRAGDQVLLTGDIYTARDLAHKRIQEAIDQGLPLPFPLKGAVLFYAGPTPKPPHRHVGSVGPTTSGRMDPYAPLLYSLGVKATIGKGPRSPRVKEVQLLHQCLYMAALGGGAALLSLSILSMEVVAFPELGPEAVYLFKVRDFPLTVINDLQGGDFYLEGPARYREGRP